jgi:hypothetical protein
MVKLKTAMIGYFEAILAGNRLSIAYFGFKRALGNPLLICVKNGFVQTKK